MCMYMYGFPGELPPSPSLPESVARLGGYHRGLVRSLVHAVSVCESWSAEEPRQGSATCNQ